MRRKSSTLNDLEGYYRLFVLHWLMLLTSRTV